VLPALERWALRESAVHRLDPRTKILGTAAFLVSVALGPVRPWFVPGVHLLWILALGTAARLPLAGLLARGAVVLPFVGGAAAINYLWGDPSRAVDLLVRAYLSACAAALLLAVTPFPRLMAGLGGLGLPRFFTMVLHLLYRYLHVLGREARALVQARRCRAPFAKRRALRAAAAGSVASLFARTASRAERIHRAMLARGYEGGFPSLRRVRWRAAEWFYLAAAGALFAALQFAGRMQGAAG